MSTRNISLNKLLTILFFIAMDVYVYFALRKSIHKHKLKNIFKMAYFISVTAGYIGLYLLFANFAQKPLQSTLTSNLFIGFFFSFFVFKLLLVIFFLVEDIVRIVRIIFLIIRNFIIMPRQKVTATGRRNFVRKSALLIAAVPFASMLYGITKGKYNFKVNKIKLSFKNLPKAFHGFKIVQISDIHSGSFDSKDAVIQGIDMINEQNADVILFTGDLVNNDSREIEPFLDNFKRLEANHGIYSILGNHDYGDYKNWNSDEEKEDNLNKLFEYHKKMNFQLLNNQNAVISKDGQEIGIFGVENWGNPPFPQLGDLDLALEGADNIPFKILLSHDPTHWAKKVIPHQIHFDLTLSGHTHGMQFGIEIPGFKWSPIKYIYPQWAGLYKEAKQYLYVNRGFGFLGFPGRAGIWPEITVIELNHIS
jgi:predicted MPP superfamily phosphohydrolase